MSTTLRTPTPDIRERLPRRSTLGHRSLIHGVFLYVLDGKATKYELRCGECGKSYGNQPLSGCPDCLAPLEVQYDLESVRGRFTRETVAAGPANIWRYKELLPIPEGFQPDLPVGFTPLVRAKHLGKRIGAANLYVKNDAVCFPTLSFKDRVVAVALANAQALRLHHGRLLVHRQPRELGRRAGRAPRPEGLHPRARRTSSPPRF